MTQIQALLSRPRMQLALGARSGAQEIDVMKIDDAKWNEIIQVVQTGISKWHARAAEHGLKDQFRCHVKMTADGYTVLFTKHIGAWGPVEKRTIIRDAGGEVRAAKARWKKSQIIGVTLKGRTRKRGRAWQTSRLPKLSHGSSCSTSRWCSVCAGRTPQ